jgi:hypothetical protein
MLYKAELIARALEDIKSQVSWRDTQWLEEWLWELKTEQLKSYLNENDSQLSMAPISVSTAEETQ